MVKYRIITMSYDFSAEEMRKNLSRSRDWNSTLLNMLIESDENPTIFKSYDTLDEASMSHNAGAYLQTTVSKVEHSGAYLWLTPNYHVCMSAVEQYEEDEDGMFLSGSDYHTHSEFSARELNDLADDLMIRRLS